MSWHDLALAQESFRGHGILSPLLTANVCMSGCMMVTHIGQKKKPRGRDPSSKIKWNCGTELIQWVPRCYHMDRQYVIIKFCANVPMLAVFALPFSFSPGYLL